MLYIENIFVCGYICADLVKVKISTAQNIPLLQYMYMNFIYTYLLTHKHLFIN